MLNTLAYVLKFIYHKYNPTYKPIYTTKCQLYVTVYMYFNQFENNNNIVYTINSKCCDMMLFLCIMVLVFVFFILRSFFCLFVYLFACCLLCFCHRKVVLPYEMNFINFKAYGYKVVPVNSQLLH